MMWNIQKSDLEKNVRMGVCVCVRMLKFRNLVWMYKRWDPFFGVILVEIDSWIEILWRFEFFEKCL